MTCGAWTLGAAPPRRRNRATSPSSNFGTWSSSRSTQPATLSLEAGFPGPLGTLRRNQQPDVVCPWLGEAQVLSIAPAGWATILVAQESAASNRSMPCVLYCNVQCRAVLCSSTQLFCTCIHPARKSNVLLAAKPRPRCATQGDPIEAAAGYAGTAQDPSCAGLALLYGQKTNERPAAHPLLFPFCSVSQKTKGHTAAFSRPDPSFFSLVPPVSAPPLFEGQKISIAAGPLLPRRGGAQNKRGVSCPSRSVESSGC